MERRWKSGHWAKWYQGGKAVKRSVSSSGKQKIRQKTKAEQENKSKCSSSRCSGAFLGLIRVLEIEFRNRYRRKAGQKQPGKTQDHPVCVIHNSFILSLTGAFCPHMTFSVTCTYPIQSKCTTRSISFEIQMSGPGGSADTCPPLATRSNLQGCWTGRKPRPTCMLSATHNKTCVLLEEVQLFYLIFVCTCKENFIQKCD